MFDFIWPSAQKLEKLRQEGRVPYSQVVTRSSIVLTLLLVFYILIGSWREFLINYQQVVKGGELSINTEFFLESGLELLMIPIIAAAIVAGLFGLLQTKFFIRAALVAPDFTRFNPFTSWSLQGLFSKVFKDLVTLVIALVLGGIGFWYAFPVAVELFALDPVGMQIRMAEYDGLAVLVGVVAAILGFVAWVLGWLFFMWRNAMTRAEIEQEMRQKN